MKSIYEVHPSKLDGAAASRQRAFSTYRTLTHVHRQARQREDAVLSSLAAGLSGGAGVPRQLILPPELNAKKHSKPTLLPVLQVAEANLCHLCLYCAISHITHSLSGRNSPTEGWVVCF